MNVQKPNLHPLAKSALVEIQAAGVEITPEIVLWVHSAAEKIRKTPLRPESEIIDWPIFCGGARLNPLSFGAIDWLSRLPESMRYDLTVVGFAAAHSFDMDALAVITTARDAMKAVNKWARGLKCSRLALQNAVDALLDNTSSVTVEVADPQKRKPQTDSWKWGALIRALCTKYPGTSPEYWTWSVSREKCYEFIAQLNEELQDGEVTDYEVESNMQFRAIVEHIKRGGA